jgi:hypothetical protein
VTYVQIKIISNQLRLLIGSEASLAKSEVLCAHNIFHTCQLGGLWVIFGQFMTLNDQHGHVFWPN